MVGKKNGRRSAERSAMTYTNAAFLAEGNGAHLWDVPDYQFCLSHVASESVHFWIARDVGNV